MPNAPVTFFRLGVVAWRTQGLVSLGKAEGRFRLRIEVTAEPGHDTVVDAFQVAGLMSDPHPIANAPLTIPEHGLGCDLSIPLFVKRPCPLGSECPLEAV